MTLYYRMENKRRDRVEGGRPAKGAVLDVIEQHDLAPGEFTMLWRGMGIGLLLMRTRIDHYRVPLRSLIGEQRGRIVLCWGFGFQPSVVCHQSRLRSRVPRIKGFWCTRLLCLLGYRNELSSPHE